MIYSNTLSDVNLQFLQGRPTSISRSVTETGTYFNLSYHFLENQASLKPKKAEIIKKMSIINEDNDEADDSFQQDLDDELLGAANLQSGFVTGAPSVAAPHRLGSTLKPTDLPKAINESNGSNSSTISRKGSYASGSKFRSSIGFSRRSSSIMRSSKSLSKIVNPHEKEEFLVIYYIAIVIRL